MFAISAPLCATIRGMKTLAVAALIVLSGCVSVPDRVAIEWKRGTPEEIDRACRKTHGAHAIVLGHYRGCSVFNRDAKVCTVWAADFTLLEREKMATLGHELKHCFDGQWH
jgi:hypothetical protein